ncbi:MAG: hypothetical protein N2049_05410 [Anaerolineales bacterium]|nr:hypothetical protein [Anaerolineales bacterium]MDW8227742.1 hypothetical protein [Anaerolineales bacterium]
MSWNTLLRTGLLTTAFVVGLAAWFAPGRETRAAGEEPPGPDRYEIVEEEYTRYFWWLVRWSNDQVICEIVIEHSGLPTPGEIYAVCGESVYKQWLASPPCSISDKMTCSGFYLYLVRQEQARRQIGLPLPPPVVWLKVAGCTPYFSSHRCLNLPTLILFGEEPLTEHSILALHGSIDEKPFTCAPICRIELGPTDEDGILLRFWAESSYGDTSIPYQARVRVARKQESDDRYWYIDVLSDRWRGAPLAPCSLIWEQFPPIGGLTGWLATPDRPEELASSIPYGYLAGQLIRSGVVDASDCPEGGIQANGYANACGLEIARPAVHEWQNRFDELIFYAAQDVGVPAQLLKNLFSQESQFWPGISSGRPEAGLGQLTENGADTVLLWNRPFFEQFCVSVFVREVCQRGYAHLTDEQREGLRSALVERVNAFCADCPLGIDLQKAEASILIFAETLAANCAQMKMVLALNYPNPNPQPTYEDLWRFTLVNYHVGPGCLGLAVDATRQAGQPLSWSYVSTNFTPVCQRAVDYVHRMTSTP